MGLARSSPEASQKQPKSSLQKPPRGSPTAPQKQPRSNPEGHPKVRHVPAWIPQRPSAHLTYRQPHTHINTHTAPRATLPHPRISPRPSPSSTHIHTTHTHTDA